MGPTMPPTLPSASAKPTRPPTLPSASAKRNLSPKSPKWNASSQVPILPKKKPGYDLKPVEGKKKKRSLKPFEDMSSRGPKMKKSLKKPNQKPSLPLKKPDENPVEIKVP